MTLHVHLENEDLVLRQAAPAQLGVECERAHRPVIISRLVVWLERRGVVTRLRLVADNDTALTIANWRVPKHDPLAPAGLNNGSGGLCLFAHSVYAAICPCGARPL